MHPCGYAPGRTTWGSVSPTRSATALEAAHTARDRQAGHCRRRLRTRRIDRQAARILVVQARTRRTARSLGNAPLLAAETLDTAAAATIQTLETIQQIAVDAYTPANGAIYAESDFGRALKQTAALIKADVGLEVACVDLGNFDTHVTQGVTIHQGVGIFPGLAIELANNLRAFHDDLLEHMGHVTVVAMSEFGRRVQEMVQAEQIMGTAV